MIDIHSHIIFDVDDGSRNIEDSLQMIQEASEVGVDTIICTPHFSAGLYESERAILNLLKLQKKADYFNVTLLLGYEMSISSLVSSGIMNLNGITLNHSSFLLVEFPSNNLPSCTFDILYNLQVNNINPIIAHPERCSILTRNFALFEKLFSTGCYIQVDAASVCGVFGGRVKRFTKKIIKKRQVHFIASDAHSPGGYSKWYRLAYKKIMRWVDNNYLEELFGKNVESCRIVILPG